MILNNFQVENYILSQLYKDPKIMNDRDLRRRVYLEEIVDLINDSLKHLEICDRSEKALGHAEKDL
jgi:hypothetical protein